MGAERVDYYSDEEFQQALEMEQRELMHMYQEDEMEKAYQEQYEAELMEEARRLEEKIKAIKEEEDEG